MKDKNNKRLNLLQKTMIAIYKMSKTASIIFIVVITVIFLTGVCLILSGIYLNNSSFTEAYSNPITLSGVGLLCFTLLIVAINAVGGNYGGYVYRKHFENSFEEKKEKVAFVRIATEANSDENDKVESENNISDEKKSENQTEDQ